MPHLWKWSFYEILQLPNVSVICCLSVLTSTGTGSRSSLTQDTGIGRIIDSRGTGAAPLQGGNAPGDRIPMTHHGGRPGMQCRILQRWGGELGGGMAVALHHGMELSGFWWPQGTRAGERRAGSRRRLMGRVGGQSARLVLMAS